MTTFICEFCKASLSSVYTLRRHKITTTKCIEIQKLKKKNEKKAEELESKDEEKELLIENKNSIVSDKYQIEFNGIIITARHSDNYINVTQLCKAGGKSFGQWKCNKETESFLKALNSTFDNSKVELIQYTTGSNGNRASWVHRKIGIEVARWISPEFGVKIVCWIDELLMTGSVSLRKEKSQEEIDLIIEERLKESNNHLKIELENKDLKYEQKLIECEKLEEKNVEYENELEKKIISTKFKKDIEHRVNIFEQNNIDFDDLNTFYIAHIDDIDYNSYLKFGYSTGVTKRISVHAKSFPQFRILDIIQSNSFKKLETNFKKKMGEYGLLTKYPDLNGREQCEIIKIEKESDLHDVFRILYEIKNKLESKNDNPLIVEHEHQKELWNKEKEFLEYKAESDRKIFELEKQILKMEIEMLKNSK
jgi:hypothetical protein